MMSRLTRRGLMRTAAVTAGAAAVTGGSAGAAWAGGRRGVPTFVLVNETCASSRWWTALSRELGLRGYRTVAVDLPGHGVEGHFPVSYQAPQDLDLPLALQDRMIAEADRLTPRNRFDVRSVPAPHAGPMHRPEVVAILDELGRRAGR